MEHIADGGASGPGGPDEETLRRYLHEADAPALLMTLVHLTGDLSLLDGTGHGDGWLLRPQGGLPPDVQARVRRSAFDLLRRRAVAGPPGSGGAAPVPPPDRAVMRRLAHWLLGEKHGEAHLPLLAEEVATAAGTDLRAPAWHKQQLAPGVPFRVVVVGAGLSGLLAAHRLTQAGVDVTVVEKNPDVGGTWYDNRYPGCRVDVPSHLYSYSFAPRADWPDHFCTQSELLAYLRDFASRNGLYPRIRFRTEAESLEWDERALLWRLVLHGPEGRTREEAQLVVSAVGQLSRPLLPDIAGREDFAGPAFHTARWDASAPLGGRRVGVIGTGASAFQVVPALAGECRELTVFQRTPPWLRPTPHYRSPVPDGMKWLNRHLPYHAAWQRLWLLAPGLRGVLEGWTVDPDYPPTERAVSAANEELRAALTAWLEEQLADAPELLPQVLPDYPVGAKRVLRDDGSWLAALRQPHVRLVTDAIDRITPDGVRTADGAHHRLDVLVYGTGFRAAEFLSPMRVTGRGGADLHTVWNGDARAHLGATVPGFPNLFCLYGPNTNLAGQGGSIVFFSECAVAYLLDAVRTLLARGGGALEVRRDAHDAYNAWVDAGNAERAWTWSKANTWHVDRRTGRSAQNWPFSALEFWRRTRRLDPAHHHFTPRDAPRDRATTSHHGGHA